MYVFKLKIRVKGWMSNYCLKFLSPFLHLRAIKEQGWDLYWKARKLNYLEAILDFSKAIEIDPKDSFLYFWRGFAYESLEEYPNAVKDLKIAKHLDPGFTLTASILENIETKGF